MILNKWSDQLIAQTQVQGQTRRDFPIILEKKSLLPVVHVHGGTWKIHVRYARSRQTQQKLREWIDASSVAIGHRPSDVSTIDCKPVNSCVTNKVSAHCEGVFSYH